MSLTTYRQKRQFNKTSEPSGREPRKSRPGWQFVVQKHDASHLHYDFRLEHDGVLKSWAVPKGPSLDATQKRLAVQVEDHPKEYGGFEGTIPEGQYGGGTVMLWDRGTWHTDDDVNQAFRTGRLKFELRGEKLKGRWSLIRMRRKSQEKRDNWLLIKERDEEAHPLSELDILDEQPASVLTGRTIQEIATGSASVRPVARRERRAAAKSTGKSKLTSAARRSRPSHSTVIPKAIEPQLATLVDEVPTGEEWLHEIKFDGYRILAFFDSGEVKLQTRNQNDWTNRFPEIAKTIEKLKVQQAVLDGEVVALLADGRSSFQGLQTALSERRTSQLVYCVFDLLYFDGTDLRSLPLEQRKELLAELVRSQSDNRLQFSDQLEGDIPKLIKSACQQGWEGIVSKQRAAAYTSGRCLSWLKTKCIQTDEFVIGGFTDSSKARRALKSLLVGYFDPDGQLIYAGKVGSGFSVMSEADLRERLKSREQPQKPFATATEDEHQATTHWVRPELVAQLRYTNWTDAGRLRHPVFEGLREDKPATDVVYQRKGKVPHVLDAGEKVIRRKKAAADPPRQREISLTTAEQAALQQVTLTHPERVLYPELGLTKQDLVAYYAEVGPWMLPHVVDRPLSILRCPEGEGSACFFQKHFGPVMPGPVREVMISEKAGQKPYATTHDLAGLLSLVQIGALEVHPWGSKIDDVDKPDRLIFDLDPDPSVAWKQVVAAAQELRDRLQHLGLESFPKLTGGKGIHLVVPIQRRHTWPEVKQFSKAVAAQLAADSPREYTANMSKAARTGRIFVDYLRNDRGATAIAPYSTRNRPWAPIATPMTWKEVAASREATGFNVESISRRLAKLKNDPWEGFSTVRQALSAVARRELKLR